MLSFIGCIYQWFVEQNTNFHLTFTHFSTKIYPMEFASNKVHPKSVQWESGLLYNLSYLSSMYVDLFHFKTFPKCINFSTGKTVVVLFIHHLRTMNSRWLDGRYITRFVQSIPTKICPNVKNSCYWAKKIHLGKIQTNKIGTDSVI